MNVKVKASTTFKKQAKKLLKKYISLDNELRQLETIHKKSRFLILGAVTELLFIENSCWKIEISNRIHL